MLVLTPVMEFNKRDDISGDADQVAKTYLKNASGKEFDEMKVLLTSMPTMPHMVMLAITFSSPIWSQLGSPVAGSYFTWTNQRSVLISSTNHRDNITKNVHSIIYRPFGLYGRYEGLKTYKQVLNWISVQEITIPNIKMYIGWY